LQGRQRGQRASLAFASRLSEVTGWLRPAGVSRGLKLSVEKARGPSAGNAGEIHRQYVVQSTFAILAGWQTTSPTNHGQRTA